MSKKNKKDNTKDTNLKTSNKKNKQKDTENSIPKTVADTIPYQNVYDNGIIQIDATHYSKTYKIDEANFVTRSNEDQEAIATQYSEFLSSFEDDITIEISLYNKTIDEYSFENKVLIPMRPDGYDEYRKEYNDIVKGKMKESKNNLTTEKYLTITVEVPDVYEATNRFVNIDKNVNDTMYTITGKSCKPMNTVDRLDLLNNIYNQKKAASLKESRTINGKEYPAFSLENCAMQGITTKDVIAPSSFDFPKNYAVVGDKLVKTFFVSYYPTWIKGTIFTDFADISTNALVSVYFKPIEQQSAIKYVRRQGTNVASKIVETQKKSARQGIDSDLISPGDQTAKDEIREMLDSMTRDNVSLFTVVFVITIFADDEEQLATYENQVRMISNKHQITTKSLDYQQENGLNTALPIGKIDVLEERLMTSLSVASIIPFRVNEYNQTNGMYYGQNAFSHNLILYNRSYDPINPNGCILGMPGSGKSFIAKKEMINVLLNTDDEVYVIDPEREYKPIAQAFNGSIAKISFDSKNRLNPFDLNINNTTDEESDPVRNKCNFIRGIIEIMIGGKLGLSPAQESIIDRVTMIIYDDYVTYLRKMGLSQDSKHAPTLKDFYNVLLKQPDAAAAELGLSLEKFVKGSSDIFSHQSNVDITNRFTVFDLKDATGSIREIALNITFDYIWNKMIENFEKGKTTWIYIDEFHFMMNNQSSAEYIAQIWKRARKWHGVPCAITQNVEDMLNSNEARTVINNCSFIIMMKQSSMNMHELSKLEGLSTEEQKFINSPKPGTGLIKITDTFIPMNDIFPTDTNLYKIMTTKPEERL